MLSLCPACCPRSGRQEYGCPSRRESCRLQWSKPLRLALRSHKQNFIHLYFSPHLYLLFLNNDLGQKYISDFWILWFGSFFEAKAVKENKLQ